MAGVALSWFLWLLLSPSAWLGCKFQVGQIFVGPALRVRVKVGQDMDLTKIATVYAKVSGAENQERLVPKPDQGWPNDAEFVYHPDTDGDLVFTITAYDASHRLIGLGRGESHDHASVEIVVRSTIAWN